VSRWQRRAPLAKALARWRRQAVAKAEDEARARLGSELASLAPRLGEAEDLLAKERAGRKAEGDAGAAMVAALRKQVKCNTKKNVVTGGRLIGTGKVKCATQHSMPSAVFIPWP